MFARNVPTIWYSQNTWVARALRARFPKRVTLAAPYRQMLKLHLLDTVVFAEANMVSILLLLHVKYRSGSRIRSDLHGLGRYQN